MKIVGVGCGPLLLTGQAEQIIRTARSLYGSKRAIDLVSRHIPEDCTVTVITDFKALDGLPDDAVLLSTGDPMLAGLGYLRGEIVPGISSLQVAAARLRVPLDRIVPVIAHGKGHNQAIAQTCDELARGRIVFLLPDPRFDLSLLYRAIRSTGSLFTVAVCEDLGYPEERIATGSGETIPYPSGRLYSLMIGDF